MTMAKREYRATMTPILNLPNTSIVQQMQVDLRNLDVRQLEPPPLEPPDDYGSSWTVEQTHVVVFGGFPLIWCLWGRTVQTKAENLQKAGIL